MALKPITIADIWCLGIDNNLDKEEILSMHQSYSEQLEPMDAIDYYNRNLVVVMYIFNIISKKDLRKWL